MPSNNPLPLDIIQVPLTRLSIATVQETRKFGHLRMFPPVPVDESAGKFYDFDSSDFLRDEMQEVSDGDPTPIVGYKLSNLAYDCKVEAIGHRIGPQRRANYRHPALDPDRATTLFLTQKALIRSGRKWATKFFGTSLWTTERAGVASGPTGNQFLRWDVAASIPIADVQGGKRAVESLTGYTPNILGLSPYVFDALKRHADVRDYYKYVRQGVITEELLAGVFEVDEVVQFNAIYESAAEGMAKARAYMVGKHALLAYRAPAPDLMQPSAGYHFVWRGLFPQAGEGEDLGIVVTSERIPGTRGADEVTVQTAWDPNKTGADYGAFFLDAVS